MKDIDKFLLIPQKIDDGLVDEVDIFLLEFLVFRIKDGDGTKSAFGILLIFIKLFQRQNHPFNNIFTFLSVLVAQSILKQSR